MVYFTSSNYFQFSSATAWKLHQHFDVDLCSVCVRYTRALHFRIENLWRIPTVDPRWLNERGEVPERGEAEHTERSRRALLLSEAARLLEQLRRRPAGGSLPHGVQEAQARRRPRARRAPRVPCVAGRHESACNRMSEARSLQPIPCPLPLRR